MGIVTHIVEVLTRIKPTESLRLVKCEARKKRNCSDSSGFVYYESITREAKRRLTYEYRCDERLKTKNEESTRLTDTGLVVELEHLKTKTRLKDEKFANVRGECET